MKIINIKGGNLTKLIKETLYVLSQGGLVIFPSDTVYGLLVDAANEKAVEKLIKFKNRPPGKPISVFVSDFKMMKKYVEVNNKQEELLKQLLPGPFTVILKSCHNEGTNLGLSNKLLSERKTLGTRIPDYQSISELVSQLGRPITATSANLSGRSPHYSIKTLLSELPAGKKELIDLIIDAGKLPRNKPSTIIDLTTPEIRILRQGDVIFKNKQTFISKSPNQTKKIAQYILNKITSHSGKNDETLTKPLVFILEGDLGVGKTIFVKGIGEYLGIKNIISPTYVIYYEYVLINQLINTLVHIDLYNIQEAEEFKYLHLEKYLKPENLLCIEWGEKAEEILDLLRQKGMIIFIKMIYINEITREIEISY